MRCLISQKSADLVYFVAGAWDQYKEFTLQTKHKTERSTVFRWTTKGTRTCKFSVPLVYGMKASRCNFLIRINSGATM
jgi:hypothetical protein